MARAHDPELINMLEEQTATLEGQLSAAQHGKGMRSVLREQAQTLDRLFRYLGERALNEPNHATQAVLLKLGLRAQSQCVLTARALADIPATGGEEQSDLEDMSNEALARIAGLGGGDVEFLERMDRGTEKGAVQGDPAVEALDQKHGAEDA